MRWWTLGLAIGCGSEPARVVFAGDLAPARGLTQTLRRHRAPWEGMERAFGKNAVWVANLEAAVAPDGPCPRADGLCLRLDPADLERVTAGPFGVLSRANNHSADFGPDALEELDDGRFPASGETAWVTDGDGQRWAIVPLDLTSARRADLDRALRAVSRARMQTSRVVGVLHSALEYDARLDAGQKGAVKALHAAGAVLVVGSGAHVVQESECGDETVTFAGLGNLWMDQRPEATQTGLALGCSATEATLTCVPQPMRHDVRTPPEAEGPPGPACAVPLGAVDDRWTVHPRADRFEQVLPLPAAGPDAFVALWSQYSDFDHTTELRPYVFRVSETARGAPRVEDLWRGTSLASPIALLRVGPAETLCVLHRTDDVFRADADTGERRLQAWRWTGFGFTPADDVACPK